jgi:hypothetical protein
VGEAAACNFFPPDTGDYLDSVRFINIGDIKYEGVASVWSVCLPDWPTEQLTKRAATSRPNRNTSKVPYNGKILTQQRLSRTRFNGRRTSVNRAVIVTDNDGDNKLRVCAHTLLSSESTIENKNPQTDFCLHKRY